MPRNPERRRVRLLELVACPKTKSVKEVMMDSNQQFCLRWHNYQSSLLASLPQLLDGDDLTDVTLSAGGRNLRAHRVVLSACSQYFKDLFKVLQPLQHPVIVLPGANFTDLCALVTFMYSGEVNIYQEQLPGLLSMADAMQIRGLAEVNGTSGKNAEMHAPKKDVNASSTPKRAKMSCHSAQNQTPATEGRAMQADAVDMHGHLLKGKSVEYELYGATGMGHASKLPAGMDSEMQYASLQLRDEAPSKSLGLTSENLEHYVDSIGPKRLSRREEGATPLLSLAASASERVKVEPESNTRISPDLTSVLKRAAGMEEMELSSVEGAQAQQSPSSEDSGGGSSYGPDPSMAAAVSAATAAANRVHLSPGPHFSSLKFSYSSSSSSPSANSRAGVAVSSNVAAGKLFATCLVCGKQLSNQYNLRVHMETHQNVNYACGVCSHVSRSRDALRKHVSYRHPPEGRDKSATLSGAREGRKGANGLEGKIRAPMIPSGNNGLGIQSTEMNVDKGADVTGIRAGSQLVAEDMTSKKGKAANTEENMRP